VTEIVDEETLQLLIDMLFGVRNAPTTPCLPGWSLVSRKCVRRDGDRADIIIEALTPKARSIQIVVHWTPETQGGVDMMPFSSDDPAERRAICMSTWIEESVLSKGRLPAVVHVNL
jgi:hypothetical protein